MLLREEGETVDSEGRRTSGTANSVPVTELPLLKDLDSKQRACYEKIFEKENSIRGDKDSETAFFFDANGKILLEKTGDHQAVQFSSNDVMLIQDAIITHNHPAGVGFNPGDVLRIGNSLSITDILLGIEHDALELRVVTGHYTFSMKRPEDGWPSVGSARASLLSWEVTLNKEDTSFNKSHGFLYFEGSERRNLTLYHRICKLFSSEFGVEYKKAKTKGY